MCKCYVKATKTAFRQYRTNEKSIKTANSLNCTIKTSATSFFVVVIMKLKGFVPKIATKKPEIILSQNSIWVTMGKSHTLHTAYYSEST